MVAAHLLVTLSGSNTRFRKPQLNTLRAASASNQKLNSDTANPASTDQSQNGMNYAATYKQWRCRRLQARVSPEPLPAINQGSALDTRAELANLSSLLC